MTRDIYLSIVRLMLGLQGDGQNAVNAQVGITRITNSFKNI